MDELRVCKDCGRELTLDHFQSWTKKDGTVMHSHQCYSCQRFKANKRFRDKKKFGEIAKFEDEILIKEAIRRGYAVVKPK